MPKFSTGYITDIRGKTEAPKFESACGVLGEGEETRSPFGRGSGKCCDGKRFSTIFSTQDGLS